MKRRFGLRERRVPKGEIAARVEGGAGVDALPGRGAPDRRPAVGGEQQRVRAGRTRWSCGRAAFCWTSAVEPGRALRHSMRDEIRRLCKEARPHDDLRDARSERGAGRRRPHRRHDGRAALAGGAPAEIYRRPRSRAVASFLGETKPSARARRRDGRGGGARRDARGRAGGGVGRRARGRLRAGGGRRVWVSIPARGTAVGEGAGPNTLRGSQERSVYLGELGERHLRVGEADPGGFRAQPSRRASQWQSPWPSTSDPTDVVLLRRRRGPARAG